jgi:hypothetical protein
MKKTYQLLMGLIFLSAVSVPAIADTQFQVRQTTRRDIPVGMGQCDIRVMIDDEADVVVTGNLVRIHPLRGAEGRDAGSECNAPLPARAISGFNFQVMDERGQVALLSQPTGRSGAAVVRIRDSQGGAGRYHFRLSWNDQGYTTQGYPNNYPGSIYDNRYPGDYGRPGDNPRGGGYGRGGRWRTQGLRMTTDDAVNMCADAVRNDLSSGGRINSNNIEILNPRTNGRSGNTGWIAGDASIRRGFFGQQYTFNCQVDFVNGSVMSLDVRRR